MLAKHSLDKKSYNQFMQFRELHYQCAGRRTRSLKTWDIQFSCIEEGSSFCILGYLDGRMVTGAIFNCADGYAYYANSASLRELFDKPISHAVIWQAIQYSKQFGANILI